jgi:hypothetical protein
MSLLMWCQTTFAFSTAAVLLRTCSYMFSTVSSRILCHCSWRTSSSCSIDIGTGNLLLILVSKTDQSHSTMSKSGDGAGQGRCWSSPLCYSNHDWRVPTVWSGALSSWKTASLFGNNVWAVGCTWLPNLPTCSLADTMKLLPNHHRTSPAFHCWEPN